MARELPEELLVLDGAAQPLRLGAAAGPLPGRLARAGVVVLRALGNRVDVVPRVAFAAADLADREHERLSRQRAKAPPGAIVCLSWRSVPPGRWRACSVGVADEPEVASGASELAVDGPRCGAGVGGDLGTGMARDLQRHEA